MPLPNGEIFSNLQSGAIDGAEWVGPYNDLSLGFYKITKLYYWPGFHEPGSAMQCMVNKGKFEALPDELKQIVAACCSAENDMMLAEFNGRSPAALASLVNEHGVQLKQFPRDVLVAFGIASGEVHAGAARARRRHHAPDRIVLSAIPPGHDAVYKNNGDCIHNGSFLQVRLPQRVIVPHPLNLNEG